MFSGQPLTKETFRTRIHQALKNWDALGGEEEDLLADLLLVQQAQADAEHPSLPARRLAANQVLLTGVDALQQQDPTGSQVLRLRFMDGDTILMAARKLRLSEDQLKRRQRAAIRRLAEIVWEEEMAARRRRIQEQQAGLMPASYTRLFGVAEREAELVELLAAPDAPHIIALIGLGGIGKTALADAAVRRVSAQLIYDDVIWLRVDAAGPDPGGVLENILGALAERLCPDAAPERREGRLRHILKARPHLIVIDNLEAEADAAYMLDALRDLAAPGKFLLTSRSRLPAAAAVRSISLAELPDSAAAALIRHQAQQIDLPGMAEAPDEIAAQITAVTGGNPLAIKLVVGLTAVLPLPQILADLTAAQTAEIEEMYRHIYWQAWRTLDDAAQTALKMMPLAAGVGVTPEQLTVMSGLEPAQLWRAITALVNRSLLEARGTAWERRYGIHQLTDSFLRTEIIHWPADA